MPIFNKLQSSMIRLHWMILRREQSLQSLIPCTIENCSKAPSELSFLLQAELWSNLNLWTSFAL